MIVNVMLPLEVKVNSWKSKLKETENDIPKLYHSNIKNFFKDNVQTYELENVKSYSIEYNGRIEVFKLKEVKFDIIKINKNKIFNDIIMINLKVEIEESQINKLELLALNRYTDYKLKTKIIFDNEYCRYLFATEEYNKKNLSRILFDNEDRLEIINYPLGYYSYIIYDLSSESFLNEVDSILEYKKTQMSKLSYLYEFSNKSYRKEYIEKINKENVLRKVESNIHIVNEQSFGRISELKSNNNVTNKYVYFTKLVLLQKVGMIMFQSKLKIKEKESCKWFNFLKNIKGYASMMTKANNIKGYKEYFNFINHFYFYEITSESLPVELYTMLQKNLGVYNHYEKVNSEMQMQYSMVNEKRLFHIQVFIAVLGVIATLLGVFIAMK